MRTLYILLILIVLAAPLHAEQALVLTEIEQIQEKIWYLQRDQAAQKEALEKQKQQLATLATQAEKTHAGLTSQLAGLTDSVNSQLGTADQTTSQLQQLQEALFELNNKVSQKDTTILDMTSKIGTLEGSLQALRTELATQQTRNDQAMAAVHAQIAEAHTQLDAIRKGSQGFNHQIGLWGAVAALALAVLLTLVFALKGSRSKKRYDERGGPPRHEL